MLSTLSLLRKPAVFLSIFSAVALTSCSDGDDKIEEPQPTTPAYTIPTTYNFTNVNYSGQTNRLDMLTAMGNYMKTGNTIGNHLSASKLKAMYANAGNPFTSADIANYADLNAATTKQLKDKTFAADRAVIESYFDSLEVASQEITAGAPGKAGVVATTTGTSPSKYLLSANGVEYTQVALKHLMGAVFYYQVMESYLTETKIGAGVDNTTVKPGDGTTMEHHFDEAFGYFGAPKDFPTNAATAQYWANYSTKVNTVLGSNKKLMDAFLKGRAAISNKDMKGKDEAVATIRAEWERLVAAAAIYELNAAKAALSASTRDQARVSHYLSEGIGFVKALRYKSDRKNTDAQLNGVLAKIGDNLYNTSLADVNTAINDLASIYGMHDIKDSLK